MKLIAENIPFYFNIIYKPKAGHIINLNIRGKNWGPAVPSDRELKFFIFEELSYEEKELTYQTGYVSVIWIDSDGNKSKIAMPACEFANSYQSVEPVTSKKEITMCMLKGLI